MVVRRKLNLAAAVLAALCALVGAARPAGASVGIKTYLNGEELQFEVAPALQSGRLLVPVRGYLEAMGAELTWDSAAQKVTAVTPNHRVIMTVGEQTALVDGAPATLDVGPVIVAGRTLVPLRFLSEAMSAGVSYDAVAQRVDVVYRRPGPVSRSGLASGRGRPEAPAEPATGQVMVSDGPLNVRAAAGTDQPILAVVPTGAVLKLVSDGTDWAQIQLADGRIGWVARAYVTPFDATANPGQPGEQAARLVALGTSLVGSPYLWGGETPAGFDCSGFLKYIFTQVGIHLPRDTRAQATTGVTVAGPLRTGDIVTFTTYAPGPTHTGLYIGDGRFVHSANESTGVLITELSNPYWSARYLGARRVLAE